MLWSKNKRFAGFGLRLCLIAVLSLTVAGCLRPMYGGVIGQGLRAELAAIQVQPIPKRIGHYLGNELIFELNGTGSETTAKYQLHVQLNQKVQSPLVDTVSGRATSATILVDAHFRLLRAGQKEPIVQGVAFTTVSYDRSSQRFANIRAARDAEIRAAKTLAKQIHVRLASELSKVN